MLNLEPIEEIIKLTLYSAYIQGEEQPISLLLCANAEAGKSEELKKGILLDRVLITSDVTAYGILEHYGEKIMERQIRHILLPDLIVPMSKRWETSTSFISFLNLLVAEGVIEIRTYAFSKKFRRLVKCGVIGCVTPRELKDKRHKWLGMGFMSRMLPVSWDYTEKQQLMILGFIAQRKYRGEKPWAFKLPNEDIEVNLPLKFSLQLIKQSGDYAKQSLEESKKAELKEAEKQYGFRYQKHLQRLMMASALADSRDEVQQKDLDKVITLSKFLNLSFTKIG